MVLRDLSQLETQKKPHEDKATELVEPRSKSPAAFDMDQNLSSVPQMQPTKIEPTPKPVAPFPDMGMGLPITPQPVPASTEDDISQPGQHEEPQLQNSAPESSQTKLDDSFASASADSSQANEQKMTGNQPNLAEPEPAPENHDINFSDMELNLASIGESRDDVPADGAVEMVPEEPSFDVASFPADGVAENIGSGDGQEDKNENSSKGPKTSELSGLTNQSPSGGVESKPDDERKLETPDAALADIFANDGQADGMDFDFSLGDGNMGGDTFDDLMNDRDNTFNTMEHGDFDATFFGLDKTDDS